MRRPCLFVALLLLASSPRLATAGLDLTWNACNTSASGADNVTFDCAALSGSQLFANFQSAQAIPQFLAMDAVIDIRTAGGTLPPFWHLESGGCNQDGLGLTDAKSATLCPNATNGNLWGANGNEAVSAITAYDAGHGGSDRLRILLTISRESTAPVALTAGQNYYAFELDLATDNASSCTGCTTPAVIGWSKAILYGWNQTVEVYQSGNRLATVGANGGIPGPTVFTVRPESGPSSAPASVDLFGRNLVSGTSTALTRAGQSDIPGTGTTTSPLGDLLHTMFDITDKPDGFWNVNVSGAGNSDALVNAFRTTAAFRLDSLFPHIGGLSTTLPLTIYGSQLTAPAIVRLKLINHPDIVGTGTTVSAFGNSIQTTLGLQLADIGSWDVEVTNGDGSKKNVPGGFEVVVAMQITSVSPNAGPNTGTVQIGVGGAGFRPGASIALTRTGAADIVGQVLSVDPLGTSLQAQFNLAGQPGGLWNLRVTNAGGLPVTAGNVFVIVTQPFVTSINPTLGINTQTVAVVIGGTNFDNTSAARLTRSGQLAIPSGSTVVAPGGTSLSTTFDLTDRAVGLWNVEVTNQGTVTGQLPSAFEIRDGPHVTSVAPNVGLDTTIVRLTISGSNIQAGATTKLTRFGEADIVGTSVVLSGSTSIAANFDLHGRAAGTWNVVVTNPDGGVRMLSNGFLLSRYPVPTAILPPAGSNNQTVALVITGSAFMSGVVVRLETPLRQIPGTISTSTTGSINATFNLTGAPGGFYDVVVINPGNFAATLPGAFEVREALVINSVTPNSAVDTSVVSVVIAGAHIDAAATAKLTRNGQPNIVGTSVVVSPAGTSLTAAFDIRDKPAGLWNVVVTNPDLASSTLVNAFTIAVFPRVDAISPNSGTNTQVVSTVIIGSGFLPGLAVRLESPPETINGTIQSLVSGAISATFNLVGRPVGVYDVVVVNPGNAVARLTAGFSITLVGPSIASVNPNAAADTSIVRLAISGTGIVSGSTVKLTRSGESDIVGTSLVFSPGGLGLTASFDIRGRTGGPWNVVVATPSGTVSLPSGFTISKIPVVTAITPTFGTDGQTVSAVISGSAFLNGASAWLESSFNPAIVGNVTAVAPGGTTINVTFDLLAAQPVPAFYDVVVANPGIVKGRLVAGFEVRTVPHINNFTPSQGVDTTQVQVTIVGRLFDLDATAQLFNPSFPTIVGTGTVVAGNHNSLTTTFDLRGRPPGPRLVRVVQHDGTILTAVATFAITDPQIPLDAPTNAPADELALSVAPNPTRGPATAIITLATESAVRVTVVDLQGRELAELASGTWPAGRHEARWDGRGRQGPAPTGMYFMRMNAGGRTFMKRFVMTR